MDELRPIKHLYARAGFGLRFADLKKAKHTSVSRAVKDLFNSSETDQSLKVVQSNLDVMAVMKADADAKKRKPTKSCCKF